MDASPALLKLSVHFLGVKKKATFSVFNALLTAKTVGKFLWSPGRLGVVDKMIRFTIYVSPLGFFANFQHVYVSKVPVIEALGCRIENNVIVLFCIACLS